MREKVNHRLRSRLVHPRQERQQAVFTEYGDRYRTVAARVVVMATVAAFGATADSQPRTVARVLPTFHNGRSPMID